MEKFSPKVTIELSEYNRLIDLEYQFSFLTKNFKVEESLYRHPLEPGEKIRRVALVEREKLDFFYKNLLNVDELQVIEREMR